jgi:MarR family transcriptional regulator, transcriptional regulator for hemolysin
VKITKPRSPAEKSGIRIGFLIHDVSRLRLSVLNRINPHRQITRSETWVLTGISRRESGISQTELSRVLGMGKAATGEFVESLENKGFVQRSPDSRDRRAHCVQLTAKGWAILTQVQDVVCEMNGRAFQGFSSSELEQFADYLRRAKWAWDSMSVALPARRQAGRAPARLSARAATRSTARNAAKKQRIFAQR